MAKRKSKSKTPAGATARTYADQQRVLAMRAGGGHGKHDTRPRGERTRQGAKRAAITSGW